MPFYSLDNSTMNFVSCFKDNMRLEFDMYAKGYRFAAVTLAEKLISMQRFPDYDAYPIVFLYRHSFELYLKHFIYSAAYIAAFRRIDDIDWNLYKQHNLITLSEIATNIIKKTFKNDKDIKELLKDELLSKVSPL